MEGKRSGSEGETEADAGDRPVPEEIPDAEHELVIERAAAVDVAKSSGKCACGCRVRPGAGSAGCGT